MRGLLKFEYGTPSTEMILRVFRNVYADKIEAVFLKWGRGIYENLKIEPEKTIIAIDGKAMHRSNNVTSAKGMHVVSAWAVRQRFVKNYRKEVGLCHLSQRKQGTAHNPVKDFSSYGRKGD